MNPFILMVCVLLLAMTLFCPNVLTLVLPCLAVVCLVIHHKTKDTVPTTNEHVRPRLELLYSLNLVGWLMFVWFALLAVNLGFYQWRYTETLFSMPEPEVLWESPAVTFKATTSSLTPTNPDEVPDDLSGTIVVFYRVGCPDCEAVQTDLVNAIDSAQAQGHEIYVVSSRSALGRSLLAKYTLSEVPGAIYISTDPDGTRGHMANVLYKSDEDGNSVFDEDAWDSLLRMQEEDL